MGEAMISRHSSRSGMSYQNASVTGIFLRRNASNTARPSLINSPTSLFLYTGALRDRVGYRVDHSLSLLLANPAAVPRVATLFGPILDHALPSIAPTENRPAWLFRSFS